MTKKLIIKTQNKVAKLILNRPDVHNAFDDELIQLLIDALKETEANKDIKCVLLTSNGKNFSAGADLNWMKRMVDYSEEQNYQDSKKLAELMQTLYQLNKPTIAQVQGAAFGGAVGLIACCDIAIASTKASFCLSEVKIGLIPSVIAPYLINAMGYKNTLRYGLSAEKFSASQALQMSLISEIIEESCLDEKVNALISQLLNNSPQAMLKIKALLRTLKPFPTEDDINLTAKEIAKIRVSTEGQEGLTAFLEKRKPNWIM